MLAPTRPRDQNEFDWAAKMPLPVAMDETRGGTGPRLLAGGILAAAAAAAYANSLRCPFVFDDPLSITGNPTINRLWPPWAALHPPHGSGLTVEGRPLLNLSFAINHALGGTSVRGYHAANIAIHILATLTLYGILRRTPFSGFRFQPSAFLVALLWALHPLQTESVTYVSHRAESLAGLLYLLTLYFFIRYIQAGRRHWAWLSAGACLLGTGVKETIVTAPVIVLLFDRTFLAGSVREALRRRAPYYAALAATWIPLACLVAAEGNRGRTAGIGVGIAPWAYWATQPGALLRYLRLAAWPTGLVFDYGAEWLPRLSDALPAALALAALAAAGAWAFIRSPRPAGFAVLAFLVLLAPTSLVPGVRQTIAEHRMYLPLAPLCALAVGGIFALARNLVPRVVPAALLCVCALACLALTIGRNRTYATAVSLYRDNVAGRPQNILAWYNLGGALEEAGDHAGAVPVLREVVRREPASPDAWIRLGCALLALERAADAADCFKSALEIRPNDARAHLGMGRSLLRLGRRRDARWHIGAALRLDPGIPGARQLLESTDAQNGFPSAFVPQSDTSIPSSAARAAFVYRARSASRAELA
jgi:protein O-mannosyl-transferase